MNCVVGTEGDYSTVWQSIMNPTLLQPLQVYIVQILEMHYS